MKVTHKTLLLTVGLVVVGLGGWSLYDSSEETSVAVSEANSVIDRTALEIDSGEVNSSNQHDAIVDIYRSMLSQEYLDSDGTLQRLKVDSSLANDTNLYDYPIPATSIGEKEPQMTKLLGALLSRKDGTTNEITDVNYRIVDEETFKEWETLFTQWTDKKIEKEGFEKEWDEMLKKHPDSFLVSPTVLTFDFPHKTSVIDMMDSVLHEIEEQGGSTAPHISFVFVEFNEAKSFYKLYYAGSHIE